jgi:hypothetical protein
VNDEMSVGDRLRKPDENPLLFGKVSRAALPAVFRESK